MGPPEYGWAPLAGGGDKPAHAGPPGQANTIQNSDMAELQERPAEFHQDDPTNVGPWRLTGSSHWGFWQDGGRGPTLGGPFQQVYLKQVYLKRVYLKQVYFKQAQGKDLGRSIGIGEVKHWNTLTTPVTSYPARLRDNLFNFSFTPVAV